MRRMAVRFTLSHLLVAVIGGLTTLLLVTWLAPALFDQEIRMGQAMGGGQMGGPNAAGSGYGIALRASFAAAVTNSLIIGTLVGAVVAAALGFWLARRLLRPLQRVGVAVGELASGNYEHQVPLPRETELASLAGDVNALGAALAATERRRLELLSEVAHEMRTPLTVIDGYVEAMIDKVLPTGEEELGRVSDEVRRLRRLSDDLATLSRAQEGRLNLVIEPVDLDDLARGVVERLAPQARDAGVSLTFTAGAGTANADPDRMVQVLTNLVGNAIRATGSGGRIDVTAGRGRDSVVLSVADSGEGLAAAELERIFERFYRVPGATPRSGGSGIGLTVSRAYMRAQGGELSAESAGLGRGATFTARLPA